jgi:hypothetical protein
MNETDKDGYHTSILATTVTCSAGSYAITALTVYIPSLSLLMRPVVVNFGGMPSADQVAEHTPGLEILYVKSDNLRNRRARSGMGSDEGSDSRSGGKSGGEVHNGVEKASAIL